MYAPTSSEYASDDAEYNTQANFSSIGILMDTNDFNIINPNVLYCGGGCIAYTDNAFATHIYGAHLVNGNSNAIGDPSIDPFVNMPTVVNNATKPNWLHDTYFDNGPVDDYTNTLHIIDCNCVQNAGATITAPYIREYPQSVAQGNMAQIMMSGVRGEGSVGLVNTGGFTWGGNVNVGVEYYPNMIDQNAEISFVRTRYNWYTNLTDTIEVSLKAVGKFLHIFKSGTDKINWTVDPANHQILTDAAVIMTALSLGNNVWIYTGTGSPEGVVAASRGSLFLNQSGGAGVTQYTKEGGGATNTGWVAK